jgi:hypothetical protein
MRRQPIRISALIAGEQPELTENRLGLVFRRLVLAQIRNASGSSAVIMIGICPSGEACSRKFKRLPETCSQSFCLSDSSCCSAATRKSPWLVQSVSQSQSCVEYFCRAGFAQRWDASGFRREPAAAAAHSPRNSGAVHLRVDGARRAGEERSVAGGGGFGAVRREQSRWRQHLKRPIQLKHHVWK